MKSISTEEAAEALNNIALVQRRASILRGYERGAPHVIVWGLIWVVGYGLSDLVPSMAGPTWWVLNVVGVAGSFLLGRAAVAGAPMAGAAYGRRFAAVSAAMLAFILATYYVMQPHDAVQFGAFPALLVATIYTVFGIWRGLRWAASGVVLGVCTVAGLALFKEHFMLWMAAVGGGTLLVTGFWLRRE
jgi:hypothetical protein